MVNKTGRHTDNEIRVRRDALQEIINTCHRDQIHISERLLLKELKDKKFKVTRQTLYFDRMALSRENTFVRDMAESKYSQMIEDIYNNISIIEAKAFDLAEKVWNRSKIVKRSMPTAKGTKGVIKTSEEQSLETNDFSPKNAFLRLALDCQHEKRELMKGDVTNISVAMLGKRLDQYRLQLEDIAKNSTDKEAVRKARMTIENNTSLGT